MPEDANMHQADDAAKTPGGPLELLAPAGDWASLEAALEAGAGAVYFGLTTLNARRRARNFQQDEFARAVELVHARGARAYLTLNIDLAERELGQAARILELARQCRADAVLVRDPALLALRPEYPEIEFHFSTQTCMANTADVAAAGRLGASRVVLAREMTLREIAAASAADPGVRTEVFVQGALCFSVSGRCLLSSWVGGRSGNRGGCTSPCRVPWTVAERPAQTPLAMHDLAALHRLGDLRRAGVTGLKIEGRLKNAAWVGRAVGLYRRALDGDLGPSEAILQEAAGLGAYTGRQMTCGYLDGRRDDLTGVAGRQAFVPEAQEDADRKMGDRNIELPEEEAEPAGDVAEGEDESTYRLEIRIAPEGIVCRCECLGRTAEWTAPKTVVRRAHKAQSIEQVFAWLTDMPIQGCRLAGVATNEPEFLMVPRAVNALVDRLSMAVRQARKSPSTIVHADLPPRVRSILEKTEASPANDRALGQEPNRARLHARAVAEFVRRVHPAGIVVEGVTADSLRRVLDSAHAMQVSVALPQVFFEDDVPAIRRLVRECKTARVGVEVNSWGGWRLAQQAGVRMEGGPGLPVLNSLAARVLRDAGMRSVTLSVEADRRQLEEATAHCPVPCSLVVFGRPPLMITRVCLPDEYLGQVFEDRRGLRMTPALELGLWVFRPVEPFDLRGTRNERIRVRHLVVDLVASSDPVGEWSAAALAGEKVFRFNYDRRLA